VAKEEKYFMKKQRKKKAAKAKVEAQSKVAVQSQESPREENIAWSREWRVKWESHRNALIVIAVVLASSLGITFFSLNSLTEKSHKTWSVLGETWNTITTGKITSPELKVKDLGASFVKIVNETLGDINAVPDFIKKKNIKSLDLLSVSDLPDKLRDAVLKKYTIEKLQQQLEIAKSTNAAPYMFHSLGQMYFLNNDPAKAREYYNFIVTSGLAHPLSTSLIQDWQIVENEMKWHTEHSLEGAIEGKEDTLRTATLTTSKGKIKIGIFEKRCPTIVSNFMRLARSSFFNGLYFYKITEDEVYTGCPLGNGKGGPGYTQKGEIKDILLQRGLVVMDEYDGEEGKIGSRFFIFKKYPWLKARENYCALGKVLEGIEVLNKLTMEDILLDVSIE
jgi:cyclophilin family peptidyl-prolyl cis-trans isomerase